MMRLLLSALLLPLVLLPVAPALAQTPDNPLLLDAPRKPVQAQDFSAQTASGQVVQLAQLRGQVVFLNFWATWCVPCREEMPAMDALNQKLAGRDFRMLAVNLAETDEQVRRFVEKQTFSFDLLVDPEGLISGDYGVSNIPLTYIIDRDGNIIRRALGPRQWDTAEALQFFDQLLNGELEG